MRSLFLRTFLLFWLTVLLAAAALIFSIERSIPTAAGPEVREEIFQKLPAQAKSAAQVFEQAGPGALAGYFSDLESRMPLQAFLFDAGGRELLGRRTTEGARDLAKLAAGEDRLFVVANLGAHRATSPSGTLYSLVILQEPNANWRQQNNGELKRRFLFEVPAVILLASGLFCYFTARHVTRPVLNLRAAAAGIAEGKLNTRVDPKWKKRSDEIGEFSRDFDRMAERIEALVAGQKRLLGDVSHELRSPLSRLIVALGLLKQGPESETAELLERAGIEARRLDKMIGQLLTLARIDSGLHSDAQPFDLANLVEEVARDADFEARASGREVAVTSADACWISGSEELIRSAVENVVRNAVRFTRWGTRVEVSLRVQASQAALVIRDHGPGAPEEALTEIFQPFRRARSDQASGDGAGLGLAIADRAVRLHGGAVRAANASDGGLLVEIQLPNARPSR